MNVLVVGSGGREHAIAWKIAQSDDVEKVVCVPGNGGTATEKKCVNIEIKDCKYITENENPYVCIAKNEQCDMVVIGPEDPLAEGLSDCFWNAGIPCIGPKKDGAQLEASKNTSKEFMKKYGVACAESKTFSDKNAAQEYIRQHGAPLVVKADGLAAGKGVVVAATVEDALNAVSDLMEGGRVGSAGKTLVIEDYLEGVEISVLCAVSVTKEFTDAGKSTIVPFLPSRDHKRLYDGAKGPNTGGMGAVCPLSDVTEEIMEQFKTDCLLPTLRGMQEEGFDYRGFIFFGIMITKDGPKVLEYNVRLGDPETQAVLPLMDFDFVDMCRTIVNGSLNSFTFKWKSGFQVAPVVVSGGYPASYQKGRSITFDNATIDKSGAKIFIAGANLDNQENSKGLVTTGGRVLACSAFGKTFEEARKNAYLAVNAVSFQDAFFRTDIGLPGAAESNAIPKSK